LRDGIARNHDALVSSAKNQVNARMAKDILEYVQIRTILIPTFETIPNKLT
jgi:hypothetical protein